MAIDGDAARLPSMSRVEHYRDKLRTLDDWDPFLLAESRLPGPRANLELAVADKGTAEQFGTWRAWDAERAPVGTPHEFLAFCGVLGRVARGCGQRKGRG